MQVILKVIYFTFVVSTESDEADCGCNETAAVPKAAMPAASAPTWQPLPMEPAAAVKAVVPGVVAAVAETAEPAPMKRTTTRPSATREQCGS